MTTDLLMKLNLLHGDHVTSIPPISCPSGDSTHHHLLPYFHSNSGILALYRNTAHHKELQDKLANKTKSVITTCSHISTVIVAFLHYIEILNITRSLKTSWLIRPNLLQCTSHTTYPWQTSKKTTGPDSWHTVFNSIVRAKYSPCPLLKELVMASANF